ncbi:hypothetical protein ACFO4N_00790 [Camelliibacillus cellulosilyticus]|uniref:UDP-N-acetylenolpyruvoylglucosamine reductase C-terminal domain-containing protein n=1 Tax=Camelliibacillus cellulosilyticus TaxID=2174486 RepID=A0ABV9GI92_9BACL
MIINSGGATANDVCASVAHIKNVIRERNGIDLHTEIEIVPRQGASFSNGYGIIKK